jgi:hypothetical protein
MGWLASAASIARGHGPRRAPRTPTRPPPPPSPNGLCPRLQGRQADPGPVPSLVVGGVVAKGVAAAGGEGRGGRGGGGMPGAAAAERSRTCGRARRPAPPHPARRPRAHCGRDLGAGWGACGRRARAGGCALRRGRHPRRPRPPAPVDPPLFPPFSAPPRPAPRPPAAPSSRPARPRPRLTTSSLRRSKSRPCRAR